MPLPELDNLVPVDSHLLAALLRTTQQVLARVRALPDPSPGKA
ncbi:MAG: hypothetical protein ABI689_11765 [Thermoanaerobaculia bacterium]